MTSVLLRDPLDRWASVRPSAPAITFGAQAFTWSQWRERVLRLTGALRAAGVRSGDRLAVLDQNHLAAVELTLAASALGAAVVVLNFRLAPDQVQYVLDDSRPVLLFHGASFGLADWSRSVVLDESYEKFLASGVADDRSDASPDDVCLVMYTSGTTGRPKGAQLTQRGVVAHSVAGNSVTGIGTDDVNLVAMPLFHVGGSCYAQAGIEAGAHTILLREASPEGIFGAIAAGATRAFFVPAVIYGVLAAGPSAISAFGRLRVICYGASPMPLPMMRRALEAWPAAEFLQVYGMTELSGAVTVLDGPAHRDAAHEERLASAGQPMPGVSVRVVDPATGRDVAAGGTGELWFRTEQVMRGYLNRPDETAATILADGWLRTGDIGRVDADGFVYVLDRIKDMIISGGENVYCPEVESVLSACPGVAEGIVIGVPHERWGEAVKAIVVRDPGALTGASGAEEIIAFCRERLAHYQSPASVDFVDALPRNASGKILKRDLRAPYWTAKDRTI
ncbi:MAG TPA: AMP-binding protein [Streptosporangiaceae bacterium]|nr:AMP-binding protein [Streptosporangiaceae bacterium]